MHPCDETIRRYKANNPHKAHTWFSPRLLIVVDKFLTGFDAPPATYLYIDKQMKDHGSFQANCRTNCLDGDDKEYGYSIDYKDLFRRLEGAINDYTGGALDGYDKEDVKGLMIDRLEKAKEKLEAARETIRNQRPDNGLNGIAVYRRPLKSSALFFSCFLKN